MNLSVKSVQSSKSVIQTSKARSLNALLQPGVYYNDDVLCSAAMSQNKNGSNQFQTEEEILNSGNNGIANVRIENDFRMYPNPNMANGQVTVDYKLQNTNEALLSIYSMTGQLVQQIDLDAKATKVSFNIANLASGVYKVNIHQQGSPTMTKKLVLGE